MYRRSSHLQLRLNENSVYSFTHVFVHYAFFFSLKLHQEFISSKIGPFNQDDPQQFAVLLILTAFALFKKTLKKKKNQEWEV